jgi:hypothetical protein
MRLENLYRIMFAAAISATAVSLVACGGTVGAESSAVGAAAPKAVSVASPHRAPPARVLRAGSESASSPVPAEGGTLSTAAPVTSAWLTANQLPDAAEYDWRALGPPEAMPFVGGINVPLCPSISGETAWQRQSYQAGNETASEQIFLFPSAAQGYSAYQVVTGILAGCQADSHSLQAMFHDPTDAVVTEAISDAHDSVWIRSWTAPNTPISGGGPQTDIEYIAQAGDAVAFTDFTLAGLAAPPPSATASAEVLAAMIQHLSIYASGS